MLRVPPIHMDRVARRHLQIACNQHLQAMRAGLQQSQGDTAIKIIRMVDQRRHVRNMHLTGLHRMDFVHTSIRRDQIRVVQAGQIRQVQCWKEQVLVHGTPLER
ncbi:hypothetical protein D3C78_1302650 [compost metagenome]